MKFTAQDWQLNRLIELVERKVSKEKQRINEGIHKPFCDDKLGSHLMNHGMKEVELFNKDNKGISFDRWMKQAIKLDFIDFIRVKKNHMDKFQSYEGLKEQLGDSFIDTMDDRSDGYYEDEYFADDWEMQFLDKWGYDTLEEVKEQLEGIDLSIFNGKRLLNDIEDLYVKVCQSVK